MEEMLVDKFSRFLAQRAEDFIILRRKPVDVSITRTVLSFVGVLGRVCACAQARMFILPNCKRGNFLFACVRVCA